MWADEHPTVPLPRFALFEVALLIIRDDDGFFHCDVIKIMGVELDPPDTSIQGWWYHAEGLNQLIEPWLSIGCREPCPENVLFKLKPH